MLANVVVVVVYIQSLSSKLQKYNNPSKLKKILLFGASILVLYLFCTPNLHSCSTLITKFHWRLHRGTCTSDNDYDSGDSFSDDSSFDFPVVSLSQLHARRLWHCIFKRCKCVWWCTNYCSMVWRWHHQRKLLISYTNVQLMGSFSGDVTVTI